MITMITNILLGLLICVTSVSPNSSPNMPQEEQHQTEEVKNPKIYFVPTQPNYYSNMQQQQQQQISIEMLRKPRHTPFLPGDHWKGLRPDFGSSQTDIEVMVNGTAKMKCPITHVSDNRVSIFCKWHYNVCSSTLIHRTNIYTFA